jgi:hypothetical protein
MEILKTNAFIVEFDYKLGINVNQVEYMSAIEYEDDKFKPVKFRIVSTGNEDFMNNIQLLMDTNKIHIKFLNTMGDTIAYIGMVGRIVNFKINELDWSSDSLLKYELTFVPTTIWNGKSQFTNYPKNTETITLEDNYEFDVEIDDDDFN